MSKILTFPTLLTLKISNRLLNEKFKDVIHKFILPHYASRLDFVLKSVEQVTFLFIDLGDCKFHYHQGVLNSQNGADEYLLIRQKWKDFVNYEPSDEQIQFFALNGGTFFSTPPTESIENFHKSVFDYFDKHQKEIINNGHVELMAYLKKYPELQVYNLNDSLGKRLHFKVRSQFSENLIKVELYNFSAQYFKFTLVISIPTKKEKHSDQRYYHAFTFAEQTLSNLDTLIRLTSHLSNIDERMGEYAEKFENAQALRSNNNTASGKDEAYWWRLAEEAGYSRDTINDAFDGDPSAIWNVE